MQNENAETAWTNKKHREKARKESEIHSWTAKMENVQPTEDGDKMKNVEKRTKKILTNGYSRNGINDRQKRSERTSDSERRRKAAESAKNEKIGIEWEQKCGKHENFLSWSKIRDHSVSERPSRRHCVVLIASHSQQLLCFFSLRMRCVCVCVCLQLAKRQKDEWYATEWIRIQRIKKQRK